jgi:trehalose 6-phosphate synthase/phosphatase
LRRAKAGLTCIGSPSVTPLASVVARSEVAMPTEAARVLLVSNRLPVTVRAERRHVKLVPSTGGLATGLRAPHERSKGLWFGWPGDFEGLGEADRAQLAGELGKLGLVPVELSHDDIAHFYHGFCNGVLWPLFHYLLDPIPLEFRDWDAYRRVNQRFADAVVRHYQPGDVIWVHDYQLMLVPRMLRQRLPNAAIGFFLHIPFPSSELVRVLPGRAELLEGLLGADLIGFHTHSYLRHFSSSILRILGLDVEVDRVWQDGRLLRLGVYPMGIDAAGLEAMANEPEVQAEANAVRQEGGATRLIVAVDRLDYTKGITRRLLAFERLLDLDPELRGTVRLVQVAAPSRGEVHAYDSFRRQVNELIGQINGKFATASHVPIHSISRSLPQRQLAALYLAADVMAVTPIRDGLNLVAKEFVACRPDLGGVLVLSEFAGAASELSEALLVNPYDIDAVAAAFARALRMGSEERAARMSAMRERVMVHDVHGWVDGFLSELGEIASWRQPPRRRAATSEAVPLLLERMQSAERLLLFLDYDGTLMPLQTRPELASPDPALLEVLHALGRRPRTTVQVVSGRTRATLEHWLGQLPFGLHAEHGVWSREPGLSGWMRNAGVGEFSDELRAKVRAILDEFVRHLPGSFVEEKSAGMAWHYRQVDPYTGAQHAKELRLHLGDMLSNAPVQVIAGEKVVEVRAQGADKGLVVARALRQQAIGELLVAIGDGRTDEDLFAALPADGIGIHVGQGASSARYRLPDPAAVRRLLSELGEVRGGRAGGHAATG